MGTLSVSKMEENYLYTGCMCGIYGFIFTFCLYKNLSGVTFPVIVAVTIATAFMFLKRMGITVEEKFLYLRSWDAAAGNFYSADNE